MPNINTDGFPGFAADAVKMQTEQMSVDQQKMFYNILLNSYFPANNPMLELPKIAFMDVANSIPV